MRARPLLLAVSAFCLLYSLPDGSRAVAAKDAVAPAVDLEVLAPLHFRSIGPSRGGRVTAVAGVVQELHTFYMGSTGGGVYKTENAGQSWHNVTDGFLEVGSIGAIAVAPSDPNVVWVGTGSACPRGNVSIGRGVIRSVDAGRTWSDRGLHNAGSIGRIVVHPRDPDLAWAAVLGQIFGPNPERGVYRTKDGGASWEQVLHISSHTGAVDLAINPTNPRELYAAMWTVERKPWTLIDGSEESGLFKSVDGGESWHKLGGGLPEGVVGRIGVTVSPGRPDRVWALVSHEQHGGVYRSDDSGESWTLTSDSRELQTRGWYYSHIQADPKNPDVVWVNNTGLWRSIDAGREWSRVGTPHGDNHDMWIHPRDTDIMVQGNDGGANVSLDGGATWSSQHNQTTAEFYRVTVDEQFPYRVYGAQQDNTTISVSSNPSSMISVEQDWFSVAGAESGHIAVDPRDPDLVYSGNYLGRIDRYDHDTGYSQNVILYPQMQDGTPARELEYRFQWNAPILISTHDPSVVYHTSNFVHKTNDQGLTWSTISPDLTRNDVEKQGLPGGPIQHDHTGVEIYNTIFAFAESPLDERELWAGADDGLINVTRDAGASWKNVTPEALPVDSTINSIAISNHAPGKVIVAAYRYRSNDWSPYVFATEDFGDHWRLLTDGTNGIPADHPVRVVREDPVRPGLLYAGTEFGLFVSFDDGQHWQSLQLDLPRTPVTDLVIHHGDLVVATQGRSFYILDDLTLLRHMDDLSQHQKQASPLLLEPRTAYLGGRSVSRRGVESAPSGSRIYYWLPELDEHASVAVEITTLDGGVLRRFARGAEPIAERLYGAVPTEALEADSGINELLWDLRATGPQLVEGAVMSLSTSVGPEVPPGNYHARLLIEGREVATTTITVASDPRLTRVTRADLEQRYQMATTVRDSLSEIHDTIFALRSVHRQLEELIRRGRDESPAREGESSQDFYDAVQELALEVRALEDELIQNRSVVSQDAINYPPRIDNQFAYLYTHVISGYTRPTEGSYRRLHDLEKELAPLMARSRALLGDRLAQIEARARQLGFVAGIWFGDPLETRR